MISKEIAQKIINLYVDGYSSSELSKKFNLWTTSIGNIVSGRSWKQCTRPDNIKEIIKQHEIITFFKKGDIRYKNCQPLTKNQKDVLIGSLLGDGCVSKSKLNSSFSKTQSKEKKDYVMWHKEVMGEYGSAVDKVYSEEKLIGKNGLIIERKKVPKFLSAYRFRTCNHPEFTKLRKEWYPDGIKIIPNDLILNPLRIAVWYFDDGSNCFSHRECIISTLGFTVEEVNFLAEKLKDFDLYPRVRTKISAKTGKIQPLLKFSKQSYDNLISIVKPFMLWNCFQYKIEWRPAKKHWEIHGKITEEQAYEILKLHRVIPNKKIGEMFGITKNTVQRLTTGKTWKHLKY